MADTDNGWWREFINELPARTAKLAVVRKDGSPHVAPIWVALDGDTIVFNTGRDSLKGKSILRDGRVALSFDDERPPFSFVLVRGRAEVVEDPAQVRHWAGVIGGRYMGADRADEYGARNGVPGELLVRVVDAKIIAQRDVAG
ncbi:PPOX class F420-dependent oxidoreductase [Kutzneria sp. CA-103260]|uniref:PPOX class F420-dependent oxidoreductase n=1 Tax=Kutzneria sp. CA-103260 TaxID=2802641 RepID=UPI001BAC1F45|nr:PPOX class F420-dependent oxidoreductase [Kutzneria sp. CA-103260]QUQ70095.1 PPOX class F420-dependent oxidoreductase [Kutzneria sp. CA-103260]